MTLFQISTSMSSRMMWDWMLMKSVWLVLTRRVSLSPATTMTSSAMIMMMRALCPAPATYNSTTMLQSMSSPSSKQKLRVEGCLPYLSVSTHFLVGICTIYRYCLQDWNFSSIIALNARFFLNCLQSIFHISGATILTMIILAVVFNFGMLMLLVMTVIVFIIIVILTNLCTMVYQL